MVLRNGKIVTVDAAMPEAQAIAIRGDRIAAVGTNADIQRYIGPATQVIDLAASSPFPASIESHGHFMNFGQSKMTLDLMDVKDWNEIVSMVAAAAKQAKPGEWIIGRGWHQEKWSRVPAAERRRLSVSRRAEQGVAEQPGDADARQRPRQLRQRQGDGRRRAHREDAGSGGRRDSQGQGGRPIGLLRETASGLVGRALDAWRAKKTPEERLADARRQIELAAQASLENGVTSFHDAGANFATIDMLQAGGRRRPPRRPAVGDDPRQQRQPARQAGAIQGGRPRTTTT